MRRVPFWNCCGKAVHGRRRATIAGQTVKNADETPFGLRSGQAGATEASDRLLLRRDTERRQGADEPDSFEADGDDLADEGKDGSPLPRFHTSLRSG